MKWRWWFDSEWYISEEEGGKRTTANYKQKKSLHLFKEAYPGTGYFSWYNFASALEGSMYSLLTCIWFHFEHWLRVLIMFPLIMNTLWNTSCTSIFYCVSGHTWEYISITYVNKYVLFRDPVSEAYFSRLKIDWIFAATFRYLRTCGSEMTWIGCPNFVCSLIFTRFTKIWN